MSQPLDISQRRTDASDLDGAVPISISPDKSITQSGNNVAASSNTQVASAASMLRAASAMAAQASSGTQGLQAVSSALLSQAKAQALAGGIAQAADDYQHPINAVVASINPQVSGSSTASSPLSRTPSDSLQYSAAMSAHIASVLQSQTQELDRIKQPPERSPTSNNTSTAEAQMSQIAARAAVQEAESQLRAQTILRSAISSTPHLSSALAQRRGSADGSSASQPLEASPSPVTTAGLSASEYLKQLGLGHIALPSGGWEQSWGRDPTTSTSNKGQLYWDATNPAMGFSLSGVPSMPLMPAPPLQMLPPPILPSFRKRRIRGKPLEARHSRLSQQDSIDEEADWSTRLQPNAMSALPYPFQVVQTPGGTARAGWWVPPSAVSAEQRERAKMVDHPAADALLEKRDSAQSGSVTTQVTDPESGYLSMPFFQPIYRNFTSEEYSALASAAAYATAALTSTSAPTQSDDDRKLAAGWRPLDAYEQETIAAQLRAWAGLEGPDKQVEARQALEDRQVHIISQAAQASLPPATSQSTEIVAELSNATKFFPPDFASHYRTQLQALTEGYYARLHTEKLHQDDWTAIEQEPKASGSNSSLDIKTVQGSQAAMKKAHHHAGSLPQVSLQGMAYPPVSTPELGPGAQDPMQLLNAASNAADRDVTSPEVRDQLLRYAHGLYSSGNKNAKSNAEGTDKLNPTLLPLLHTLHKLHPQHLPTLLLLSCAYYAAKNYEGSLWYNNLILQIDPNYVESMSNIGTTLRALGRWKEAEGWWWRAIKLRPGYWDAYENLLGVMCSPATKTPSNGEAKEAKAETVGPRFQDALRLCEFVEDHIVGKRILLQSSLPLFMPPHLPITQAPRLQNLYYAKANLKYVIPDLGPVPAANDYQKAIEIVLSPSEQDRYSLRDLVVAACVVGLLSMGSILPGSVDAAAALQVTTALGLDPTDPSQAALISTGTFSALYPGGGILALVRISGDNIVNTLLGLGGGQLPMIMLLPEAATQLKKVILSETGGALPAIFQSNHKTATVAGLQQAQKQAAQTTSTILLTLAKLFQDSTANPVPGIHGSLTLGGIPPSISLLLPLYYLSISLFPSASTCNNLGILLSSIPIVTTVINASGQHQQLNGQALAMQFYTQGLQLDPKHPHIYTNLGSLLKDLSHLNEAIKMYEKAIECNPNFDVALANLGNAIKDQGRTQDSVVYYRRAVQVNPKFPEALCGLVNALLAVCDWREVYSSRGWMENVSDLVSKQLREGCQYGTGAFQSEGRLEDWAKLVTRAHADQRPGAESMWMARLRPFFEPMDRMATLHCEGGFIIRLFERLLRRGQRKWYLDTYGKTQVSQANVIRIQPTMADGQRYPKMKLPSCLVTPAVPTVLPFHTFTYPLSPRQIRLICHRNALRISQGTLTQVWLPEHVYPPPSPPSPKLNIGYISSDFNNHPLAHLMQSVFGLHDLSRFNVFLYATTASDKSPYRQKIEGEAQHFLDVSTWTNQQIVERVVQDNIHVLMNLNGYTKGARNEVFAARPCPVQMEFMGFAGSMASGWTDWIVADPIVCPPELTAVERWRRETGARSTDLGADLDPEEPSEDWVYMDRFLYMPHSYFVNDHAQGVREPSIRKGADGSIIHPHQMTDEELWAEEEQKRFVMRKQLFPKLPDDYIVLADFNQLYKCVPMLFKLWLRILKRVPKAILWLLRFPASGESHLLREARQYAGDDVAARVIFTDVAPKHVHIHRGRIADLFLDTTECNAHTTAADILWSGTPILTWPRHQNKMCSRVAASIVRATGYGEQMEVDSEKAYEDRAVQLAQSIAYAYVDKEGRPLVPTGEEQRMASCLEADPGSVAAQPHGTAVPAPAGVAQAAQANKRDTNAQTDPELKAALPPRAEILLTSSPVTPASAVSRRGAGELVELRKNLFLTRDKSPLFNTRQWVCDLEKGYREAWRRWVEGTDTEDSLEWEQLSEGEREKRSGHIWVADL